MHLVKKKKRCNLHKKAIDCDDKYTVEYYTWAKRLVKKHDKELEGNSYIG
jgi:hypothetical protein